MGNDVNRSGRISAANLAITIVVLGAVAVGVTALLRMDPRGERNPRTGSLC